MVTLSFRPEGTFRGVPGQEQFFIEKEGNVADRQVVTLPEPERRARLRMALIGGIGVLVVATVAWGSLIASGVLDETSQSQPAPTAVSRALASPPTSVPASPYLPGGAPVAAAAVPEATQAAYEPVPVPLSPSASGEQLEAVVPQEVKANLTHVSRVIVKSGDTARDTQVVVRRLRKNEAPTSPLSVLVLRNLDITLEGIEGSDETGGEIEFEVKRSWLQDQKHVRRRRVPCTGFTASGRSFRRGTPASFVGPQDQLYESYVAETPGFSVFAVGVRIEAPAVQAQATAPTAAPTQNPAPAPTATFAPLATVIPTPTPAATYTPIPTITATPQTLTPTLTPAAPSPPTPSPTGAAKPVPKAHADSNGQPDGHGHADSNAQPDGHGHADSNPQPDRHPRGADRRSFDGHRACGRVHRGKVHRNAGRRRTVDRGLPGRRRGSRLQGVRQTCRPKVRHAHLQSSHRSRNIRIPTVSHPRARTSITSWPRARPSRCCREGYGQRPLRRRPHRRRPPL